MSGGLQPRARLVWRDDENAESSGVVAHEIVIMPSGWLRVTWCSGMTVHVSPAVVKSVTGKGVSYGA